MSDMITNQVAPDTTTTDNMADTEHQAPAVSQVGGEPCDKTKPEDMYINNTSTAEPHQTDSPIDEVPCVKNSQDEETKEGFNSDNLDKKDTAAAISSDSDLKLDLPKADDKDTHGSVVLKAADVISKVEKTEEVSMSDKAPSSQPAEVASSYLQYAEVLYKCSLCATLPAILTSRDHFARHVQQVHLASTGHKCPCCHWHFNAQDDIKRHCDLTHPKPDSKIGININNNITNQYHSDKMSRMSSGLNCKSLNSEHIKNSCPPSGKPEGEAEFAFEGSISKTFDDGTDSTPCRSRRKRSFPRHLETGEQSQRSNSTDSVSSCYSEESRNSEPLDPVHQMDQSLLRSDRKRLLSPWSQWTKAPSCEKSQNPGSDVTSAYSDDESRQKSTISYKPGTLEYNSVPKPSTSLSTEMGTASSMVDARTGPGPLDLVLQDRSRSTDTPKISSTDNPHSSASEPDQSSSTGPPEHKKRKLQEEGITNSRDSPSPNEVMRMAYPSPSQYQAMYAAWSMNFYNLSRQQAAANNLMSRTCPDASATSYLGFPRVKEEPMETAEKASPSCAQCKMEFVSAEQFCQHYKEVHLPLTQPPPGHTTAASSSAGDQQFKVLWLKQHITKYLLACEGGVVLRDELLDHMMATGVDTSDTATWGPACNRAVRETFQHSQAHRKGKFKKTYFFGVKFVESLSSSSSTVEETRHSLNQAEDEATDEEEDEEEDLEYLRGPGRCAKDLEKLTAHLPCVIRWTGHMDACITRDTLLQAMSRLLADSDVTTWGLQCSRAVKQLYPEVSIRRKGKYKTTCYYGIEMINRGGRQLATWSRTNTGPPVVNVRDILETPAPNSMSRLPQNQPGARATNMTSPHNTSKPSQSPSQNPLQAILDLLPTGCQTNSMTAPMWYQRTNDRGPVVRTMCEGFQGGARSPASQSRGSSPASDRSDATKTSVTSEKESRSSTQSPQSLPLALTTKHTEKGDINAPSQNQDQPASPGRHSMTSGPVDALEKLVLLHPGPFVTARIFSRRFQRLVPGLDKVLYAMNMLQGRGLGQVFTLKQGNSKVFFKALPSKSLEVPLTVLGVRMVDYQVMFYERDQKLEDTLHEKLKAFYPQPELLSTYYSH